MKSKIQIQIDEHEVRIAALEGEASVLRKVVASLRATQLVTARKAKTPSIDGHALQNLGPLLTE